MHFELRRRLIESSTAKTALSVIEIIIGGFFSNSLIAEITRPDGLAWSEIPKTVSFYILICVAIVIYLHQRFLYIAEKDVLKFKDVEYCVAYIRSQCLPEAAERYRDLIRNGEVGAFEQAMVEIRKVLS